MVPPIYLAWSHTDKDYAIWYGAGRTIRTGANLYPHEHGAELRYYYPPFPAAAIYAPLSFLPFPAFVAALGLLNSLAWTAAILLSVYLVTGRFLANPLLHALPMAFTLPFVWDTYYLGQINLILLALMLAGVVALHHRRSVIAGVLVGLTIAIKVFPILAVPYLLYRRHWRTAVVAVVVGVGSQLILPAALQGFSRTRSDLYWWADNMLLHAPQGISQRQKVASTYRNQSLQAFTHRFLQSVPAGDHDGRNFVVNVASLSTFQAQIVFYFLAAGLCLRFVLSIPRGRFQASIDDSYEWPMMLILIVLLSPLAWGYFFCWLLPALTRAVGFVINPVHSPRDRRIGGIWTAVSVAMLSLSLGQLVNTLIPAMGTTTLGALILFFTLGWMLQQTQKIDRSIEPPQLAESAAFAAELL